LNAGAEEAEQRGRYKIQELERGLQLYQNHLGLEFRRTDGAPRVTDKAGSLSVAAAAADSLVGDRQMDACSLSSR